MSVRSSWFPRGCLVVPCWCSAELRAAGGPGGGPCADSDDRQSTPLYAALKVVSNPASIVAPGAALMRLPGSPRDPYRGSTIANIAAAPLRVGDDRLTNATNTPKPPARHAASA